jgi:DNA mismatch repair protein MutS2
MHGGERTLLISGPNTGGKTVMLKTTALVALLAQSGIVPPAGRGTALPVFTQVFTDIGDRQSLAESLSTFSGHLASLRTMLARADGGTLVLLDEVGSGTDPAEGAALAAAVLLELTRRGALTLATTHLGALKSLAAEAPGIVNGSLQFDTDTLSPTYRFRKGVPGRSYGLSIARKLGLDPGVLADAEGRVSEEVRRLDSLLARAEEREGELERRTAAMTELESVVEALQAKLSVQAESMFIREKELSAKEKDADRRARAEAKRYLLDARKEVESAIAAARASADDESARSARRALEEAAASLQRAEDAAPAMAGGGAPSALSAGQRVRLATGVTGDVLEVRADGQLVVTVGSMRMVADPEGVQVLGRREERRDRASQVSGDPPDHDAAVEVDLRGMTGDEAEGATLAAVDSAVLAELPFLRIIHGMGTGVVRERVRRVLQRDRRVAKFDFAPRQQGGTGVTIAEFSP